jgi:spermidine synthase
MGLFFDETFQGRVRLGFHVTGTVFHGQSEYQSVDVVETECFGRTLLLDGVYMTSVGDEYHYHELLVHPALTTAPAIKRVLVIGGGDGGTIREVLRYPEVEHVTLCEIDGLVIEASKKYLSAFGVPWDDPRLTVRVGDGVAYLNGYQGEPYDVILVDGADPVGPAAGLFESPFYESCKKCLSKTGLLASQTEAPTLMRDDFVRIVKTLRTSFPEAHPYFGPVPIYVCGLWSWTVASRGGVDVRSPKAERLAQIEAGCRYYNRDIHAAAFTLPNDLRRALG